MKCFLSFFFVSDTKVVVWHDVFFLWRGALAVVAWNFDI